MRRTRQTWNPPAAPFVLDRANDLARGLVAWYPMASMRGNTVTEMTGRGLTGTASGVTRANVPGFGRGWSGFAGGATTSTYITLGSSSLLNQTGAQSYAMWFYATSYSGGGENWIIGRDTDTGRSYAMGVTSGTTVPRLQINGTDTISGGTAMPSGQLHHLVFTADGANHWRAYVDGVPSSTYSASWAAPNATGTTTEIGRRTYPGNQNGFIGYIADVAFWSRELTPSDVFRLWHPASRYSLRYQLRTRKVFIRGNSSAAYRGLFLMG